MVKTPSSSTGPLDPLTIAKLYKCRWQVELFFKWIKQHLRIKAFFGTSENAGPQGRDFDSGDSVGVTRLSHRGGAKRGAYCALRASAATLAAIPAGASPADIGVQSMS
jgi:hypothetical protein